MSMSNVEQQKMEFLENVKHLKPNCLYCNTILPNGNDIRNKLPTTKFMIIRHCLRLKLLHIYGPYKNIYTNVDVLGLVAESLSDDDDQIKVLISVQLNPDANSKEFHITFDLVNVMFTLKNFLTIESKEDYVWVSDEHTNCPISSEIFPKVALVVAPEFGSVMKFHKEYDESTDSNSTASDLSTDDRNHLMSMTDDNFEDAIPPDMDWSSTPISQNSTVNTIVGKSTKTYSSFKKVIPDILKNFMENVAQASSRTEQEILEDSSENSPNDSVIANIPQDYSDDLEDVEPSVELFIRNNISMLTDEEIEITPLSEIVYPSNDIQMYNFVNIVGIITKAYTNFNEILITDETIRKEFKIQLSTKGIDWFEARNVYTKKREFCPEKSTVQYPPLRSGDIVCIRKLCLNINSGLANICAHPDQLTVVELHKENDLIVTTNQKKISVQELKFVAQLAFYNANLLLSPVAKTLIVDKLAIDLVGQLLAVKNFDTKLYSEIYLLLPDPTDYLTYLDENDEKFILEHIRNMTFHPNRQIYDARTIKELKDRKQIIKITIYENHQEILQNMMALDLALLYNVYIKKERFFNGFFMYRIHSGNDYGRRIAHVHHKSVLGRLILKKINPILKEIPIIFRRTLIVDHLDHNGTNERKMICSTRDHARTGILTTKKPLKYRGKQDRELLKPFVNTESAVRVEDFEELLSLEKDAKPNQLYRIASYMSDHDFEDEKNGLAYLNMAHLRQRRLKMICTLTECDETLPFISYFLPKSFDLMKENIPKDKSTNCPKCDSMMCPYLSIGLDLMDQRGKYLSVLFSSPECEGLVGYPSDDLIYACPADESFCKSFNYALETLCPVRAFNYSHFWPSNHDDHDNNNHGSSDGQIVKKSHITEADVNPKLDWILESVEKPSTNDLDIGCHAKPKDVEICQSKFDYYVRCIIINE